MPTEQEKADLSKKRGQAASQISDPEQRRSFISAQGESERKGKGTASDSDYEHLNKEADDTIATGGTNKSVNVPSYKTGTPYVPKTGLAKLHKGEAVIPKEKNMASNPYKMVTDGDKKPAKALKSIHTRKAKDGSYIHEHHHHHSMHPMEEHTSPDQAAMVAHMEANGPSIQPQQPEAGADAAGAAGAAPPAAM